VHSVVDLGHNLGLRVVGEGVETEEVLAHLSQRGCDLVQGYLLSRPMALDVLVQWLAESGEAGKSAVSAPRTAPAPATTSTAPTSTVTA
jgi:sensor c-di-GMP phosphodiesterase-like protein